ncbi:MAG TPA: bacterioferritin, partial [Bradyrhizobium sp.]|nr:bacterioferritin [Bradyrhizobium sp.]
MSKKTRKKSRNPSAAKTRRIASKASAKRPISKSKASPATKSSKNSKIGQTKASRELASKTLKPAAATAPKPKATPQSALAEGAKAPAFHLPRDGGNAVSLKDF